MKVLRIGGSQECALVMIEPPGQAIRARILEVDNGVFVAVEDPVVKELSRPVHEPFVNELDRRIHARLVDAREERRRAGSVKALVVKTNTKTHRGRLASFSYRLAGGKRLCGARIAKVRHPTRHWQGEVLTAGAERTMPHSIPRSRVATLKRDEAATEPGVGGRGERSRELVPWRRNNRSVNRTSHN